VQAAAFALNCPLDCIRVSETSSLDAPGSGDTGGSATSECVVKAVLDAGESLSARLAPYRVDPQGGLQAR